MWPQDSWNRKTHQKPSIPLLKPTPWIYHPSRNTKHCLTDPRLWARNYAFGAVRKDALGTVFSNIWVGGRGGGVGMTCTQLHTYPSHWDEIIYNNRSIEVPKDDETKAEILKSRHHTNITGHLESWKNTWNGTLRLCMASSHSLHEQIYLQVWLIPKGDVSHPEVI